MFKARLISPYQHDGVKWLVNRETAPVNKGGFLCDEMGLGKTVQMLATMCANVRPKTLVVVPKSIMSQWKEEVNKFAPNFDVFIFKGSSGTLPVFNPDKPTVVVASYSMILQRKGKPPSRLLGVRWDRVILDEAHEIRNRRSQTHIAAMQIMAPIRWILTGTPIFNSLKDFVALGAFIGISKSAIEYSSDKVRETFVLRRTKEDVFKFNKRLELPPADFQDVELEMYPEEKELYEAVFDAARGVASERHANKSMHMMALIESFLRTRQVCTWPQMYFEGVAKKENTPVELWDGRSKKIETLINSILQHPKEKALVFCQFIGEMDRIQELLAQQNIKTMRIDGSVDRDERESRIKLFKTAPAPSVFLIQIKAGGVGLNLQDATRVYITSPSWNPATELQAIGRAHRTGQTQKVIIRRLVYTGDIEYPSVEQSILGIQETKTKICADILNDQRLIEQMPKKKTTLGYHTLKNIFKQ
jgi:SNF2 family DNA or RNA helicase